MATQGESPRRVACLLLAAGSSSRMGKDKLALPLGSGASVLERSARALAEAPVNPKVLVVRDRSRLNFDAESLGFTVVEIGAEANRGMHRSLKMGLARIHAECDAVMICLGDQPFLRPDDYRQLLQAYSLSCAEGFDLLYPIGNGRRGNPAVVHRRYFAEILAEPDRDQGCRYLFERHPHHVQAWPAPTKGFFQDLDTLEDYRACLN